MKRYARVEVDEAIAQVERGVFTPHAQIVLAGEVEALRHASGRDSVLDAAERPAAYFHCPVLRVVCDRPCVGAVCERWEAGERPC